MCESIVPGRKIESDEAKQIISNFRHAFRRLSPQEIPDNLPTACIIEGLENQNAFDDIKFLSLDQIYILFENEQELRSTTPKLLKDYYDNRQIWEDYDFCVFDEQYLWCIGVTHNGQIFVDDPHLSVTTDTLTGKPNPVLGFYKIKK